MPKKAKQQGHVDLAIQTPYSRRKAINLSNLTYRKQILPLGSITYEGRRIDFDRAYLTDLAASFNDGAYDAVPFVLAHPQTNAHNVDPERVRGEVIRMEVTDQGLDGIIRFPDEQSARVVSKNPKLGVSARIVQGLSRVDGKKFGKAIHHVLGTLDPRVTGLAPWTEISLAGYADPDEVLDLTSHTYEGDSEMGKKAGKGSGAEQGADLIEDIDLSSLSDEEFQDMLDLALTDEDLDDEDDEDEDGEVVEVVDADADAFQQADDEGEEDEDEEAVVEPEPVQTSLSNVHRRRAARVDQIDDIEAMRIDLAARNWAVERREFLRDGVPPALLDLAAPLLSSPDEQVLDLSNSDTPVNASAIVRGVLDEIRGMIDFKPQMGGVVDLSGSASEADATLAAWSDQYGN